ncbi:MAG: hypothetical protein LWX83_08380, partial [Anaerolineae bacterium]|nr:hypothetical protein [Anaerolineae bacterium]
MTDHSIRDGIGLVGAFQFFLAVASFVGAIAIFLLGIINPLNGGNGITLEQMLLPVIGLIVTLSLTVVYLMVGVGLMRFNNTARLTAIFLGILGLMSGFVSVAGAVVINLSGNLTPDWISILMTGMMVICAYSILGWVDIFVLIFLLNHKVRALFYNYYDQ